MKPALAAALLVLAAAPVFAQSTQPGQPGGYSGPGISHTGPRYCPELADTGHPFAAVCPSHLEAIEANRADFAIAPDATAEGEEFSSPIWSNGRWYSE